MAPRRPVNPRLRAGAPKATATTEKDGHRAVSPFHPPDGVERLGRIQDAPSVPTRRQENASIPPGGKIHSGQWNVEFRAAEQVKLAAARSGSLNGESRHDQRIGAGPASAAGPSVKLDFIVA